jgi:hypothetical protein
MPIDILIREKVRHINVTLSLFLITNFPFVPFQLDGPIPDGIWYAAGTLRHSGAYIVGIGIEGQGKELISWCFFIFISLLLFFFFSFSFFFFLLMN